MSSPLRLALLSAVLLAVVFGGAYALASGGDDSPKDTSAHTTGDAPVTIATPESIDVPGTPGTDDLPDLVVPTETPDADDGQPPAGTATPDATPQATAQPTVQPTAQPTATATPVTQDEEVFGED